MKRNDVFDIKLDEEEQAFSEAIDKALEHGQLKSIPNLQEELVRAKIAATNTLSKDAQVNIRISNTDLECLKAKAAYKGLSYQTFIASVLHEYAAGHFVEVS